MASLHFLLRPPANPNLFTLRYKSRPVRCANERQALFNRIAPVYDNLNDSLSLGQHRVWKRMAVSWSGAKRGDNVLDLCCGSGDLAFLLSETVGSDGKVMVDSKETMVCGTLYLWVLARELLNEEELMILVVGFDFSREQLSVASSRQQLLSKACYKNIEWIEGDVTELPFSDCSIDAITMGYGLRNVLDRSKAMQEMFRVLKRGSRASILDFNKSNKPFITSIQEWMIDNVVVPVATGYGLADEYEYLKSSIREFLTGKELEKLALETGFSDAKHYEIGGGIMGNLVATR